jgi:hypothetical protein
MAPTPLQKTPQISPIFKADSVTLHVSREKDGKLRLAYAGWDDTKVVQADGGGQARRGWKGGILPPAGEAVTPLGKTETPLRPPWFFPSYRCRSRASKLHFLFSVLRSR